jgi:hypothetical protein
MPTTLRSTGAVWRLGLPAVLMVAFALVGVSPWWSGDHSAPAPGAAPPGAPGASAVTTPTADDSVLAPAAPESGEGAAPGRTTVEVAIPHDATPAEPSDPVLRLPEEIAPLAPDVIVALEPWQPGPGILAVPVHVHLADGAAADEPVPTAVGLAPQAGDDFQGPEQGALYWFGPEGLERIRLLEEARR